MECALYIYVVSIYYFLLLHVLYLLELLRSKQKNEINSLFSFFPRSDAHQDQMAMSEGTF